MDQENYSIYERYIKGVLRTWLTIDWGRFNYLIKKKAIDDPEYMLNSCKLWEPEMYDSDLMDLYEEHNTTLNDVLKGINSDIESLLAQIGPSNFENPSLVSETVKMANEIGY